MTRRRRRMTLILAGLATLSLAAVLVLTALEDSIVFFYSPSDIAEKNIPPRQTIRVGGLVADESVKHSDDNLVRFAVTDGVETVAVRFAGALPDLFREGQGVVVEGEFDESMLFVASNVLAKHDENYMPPEVAEALKKAGTWKGEDGYGAAKEQP